MFELVAKDPTPDNVKKLKEMNEFSSLILKIPSWPFDTKSLLSVLGTIVIPVIIILIQFLIKTIFN